MTTVLILLLGLGPGILIGRRLAKRQAAATLSNAEKEMRRELAHWQEAAARATAEAARVAREADAYKAGCQHGREEVISIVPLLIATQRRAADEARGGGFGAAAEGNDAI
jgi:hypothetical protein